MELKIEFSDTIILYNEKGKKLEFRFNNLKDALPAGKYDLGKAENHGYLEKKSRNWKEYVKLLWGGSPTWKKRFYVLSNLGLLVYEDDKMRKPIKLM